MIRLLYGLHDVILNVIWCIQSAVIMPEKYHHIIPAIWQKLEYRLLLLTHKALNRKRPVYLNYCLQYSRLGI